MWAGLGLYSGNVCSGKKLKPLVERSVIQITRTHTYTYRSRDSREKIELNQTQVMISIDIFLIWKKKTSFSFPVLILASDIFEYSIVELHKKALCMGIEKQAPFTILPYTFLYKPICVVCTCIKKAPWLWMSRHAATRRIFSGKKGRLGDFCAPRLPLNPL